MPDLKPNTTQLTPQQLAFWRVIYTRSTFSEFIRPNIEGEGFRLWNKQIVELNRSSLRKKKVNGRYLGKTICASDEFKQACVLWRNPVGVALFATKQEANLEPVFRRELVEMFKRVPLLRMFLPNPEKGVNFKTFEIRLVNGVTIRGRIEGSGGSGLNTVHPDVICWIDEVQMLSDEAISEWYGMVSPELPIIATGVPNGVRSSWAYKIDNDASYGYVGSKMTRHDDPRFTPEMNRELLEFYGGPTSSGYLNKVMGEWGADARMTFDMDRVTMDLPVREGSSTRVSPPFYHSLELAARDVVNPDGTPRLDVLALRFAFRGDMPKTNQVWFAADHGQSASPTTLYIHFWDITANCWRTYHRVLLFGMEANTQAEIIHWLADQIEKLSGVKPVIGMDTTGQGGSAVMADLQRMGHPLVRVDLREAIDTHDTRLETDDEFRKRFNRDPFSPAEKILVPIYERAKQIGYPRLARELYAGRLRLVNELELVKQLEGMTDYENKAGTDRIYVTDYHKDGLAYNHDASSYEVFGVMLHTLDVTQEKPKTPESWVQVIDIGWGVVDAFN